MNIGNKELCQYDAEREVVDILELFDAVPASIISEFLQLKHRIEKCEPEETIKYLTHEKIIHFSRKDMCYRIFPNARKDVYKVSALSVCLYLSYMTRRIEGKISLAIDPFDYVFEKGKKTFLLINYANSGAYKLKRLNDMTRQGEKYTATPIIMLVNSPIEVLKEIDSRGAYSLLPKNNYIVANVDYKIRQNMPDYVRVRCAAYKGGTLTRADGFEIKA